MTTRLQGNEDEITRVGGKDIQTSFIALNMWVFNVCRIKMCFYEHTAKWGNLNCLLMNFQFQLIEDSSIREYNNTSPRDIEVCIIINIKS
jgi:hypothetical protein